MLSIRKLVVTLGATVATFPGASLAVTLASGAATTEYVITFTGLNSQGCEPSVRSGVDPNTRGSGTASGSAVIPNSTCTGAGDAWQFIMPQWSAEGAAGLELPLDPVSDDGGSVFAFLFAGARLAGTVDEPQLVTITIEGTHSGSAQTEELEYKNNDERVLFFSSVESDAFLFFGSDDPAVPSDLVTLWSFDSFCLETRHAGRVDECSSAVDTSLDQTIEFLLHPGFDYSFRLELSESVSVGALVTMPEPATAILLLLGLFGLAGMRGVRGR